MLVPSPLVFCRTLALISILFFTFLLPRKSWKIETHSRPEVLGLKAVATDTPASLLITMDHLRAPKTCRRGCLDLLNSLQLISHCIACATNRITKKTWPLIALTVVKAACIGTQNRSRVNNPGPCPSVVVKLEPAYWICCPVFKDRFPPWCCG